MNKYVSEILSLVDSHKPNLRFGELHYVHCRFLYICIKDTLAPMSNFILAEKDKVQLLEIISIMKKQLPENMKLANQHSIIEFHGVVRRYDFIEFENEQSIITNIFRSDQKTVHATAAQNMCRDVIMVVLTDKSNMDQKYNFPLPVCKTVRIANENIFEKSTMC